MIVNFKELSALEPIKMVDQADLQFEALQDIDVASAEGAAGVAAFVVAFAITVLICTS